MRTFQGKIAVHLQKALVRRPVAGFSAQAAKQLRLRARRYNNGVDLAKAYEAEGRVLIVSPDDTCGVDTLTWDRDALQRLYEKGYRDGGAIAAFFAEIKSYPASKASFSLAD